MDQSNTPLSHLAGGLRTRMQEKQARPGLDRIALGALKKLKVRLGERVELIEWVNRSGGAMPIPVFRRTPLRPAFARKA